MATFWIRQDLQDTGLTDVVAEAITGWLAAAADILLRRTAHGGTHRIRFSELQVTLNPEQPWELDGEVMGSTRRLTVVAQPGALLLRVPRASA